jgi:hypothetical protein
MRDLYAVQLPFDDSSAQLLGATTLAAEWCSRSLNGTLDAATLMNPGIYEGDGERSAEIVVVPDNLWSATTTAPNDSDPTLRWRTQVSLSAVDDHLVGTIRIGLGATPGSSVRVSPLDYEFGAPALVRTLLREFESFDAGWRLVATPDALGTSHIDSLVEFLVHPGRRLPVVVISGDPSSGRAVFRGSDGLSGRPEQELARQLAGLAHVRMLTSNFASRQLTDRLGRQLSLWHGAVRVYWPGFTLEDDPFRHRLWLSDRFREMRNPLVVELLRWLSTLSVARTPEHPGLLAARLSQTEDVSEWVAAYEAENEKLTEDIRGIESELREKDAEIFRLQTKLDALSFGQPATSGFESAVASPRTVLEALELVERDFGDGIVFLDSAKKSAREFAAYNDPEKALRALRAVAEASEARSGGSLGQSLSEFFRSRGFEYEGSNSVAKDRRYRSSYTITYDGSRQVMEPHLKVDEHTSPDQCLRIHWWDDPDSHVLVVGHVGRHLPPL